MKSTFFLLLLCFVPLIQICTAATNRSTVWVIANNQIYSTNNLYQACSTSPGITGTTVTFLTASKLAVSGTIQNILGSTTDTTGVPNNAIVTKLQMVFTYNSTYSLTLALNDAATAAISLTTLLTTATSSAVVSTTANGIYATPSSFAISVVGGYRVLSPIGTAWLDFSTITESYAAGTNPSIATSYMIIDYISQSTIVFTQFKDVGGASDTNADKATNSFFSFGVRTATSSISASTILSSTGCSTSGRKRSVDHLLNKRYITSCPSSGLDPSLSSSTVSSICTNANAIVATISVTNSKTSANLQDAAARAINAMNALYITDMGYFSAAQQNNFSNFGVVMLAAIISSVPLFLN